MTRDLLAKIHIGKKQLGLDDDTYRDLLERVTGKRSAGQCTERQLVDVVEEMVRLGFAPQAPGAGRPAGLARSAGASRGLNGPVGAEAPPPTPAYKRAAKPQARMIWAMWNDLAKMGALENPSRAACRAFCAKTAATSAAATDPDFLTPGQFDPVISALKAWVAREKAKRAQRAKGEPASASPAQPGPASESQAAEAAPATEANG